MKIAITTSGSIVLFDAETSESLLLDQGNGYYFGITRAKDSLYFLARRTTDDKSNNSVKNCLLRYSALKGREVIEPTVPIGDGHEIVHHKGLVFITSTVDDCIVIYHHSSFLRPWRRWYPLGKSSTPDRFHFNSLRIIGSTIQVLAQNHGGSIIFDFDLKSLKLQRTTAIGHLAHNIWTRGEETLVLSSGDGRIAGTLGFGHDLGGFPRGYASNGARQCIGICEFVRREERDGSDFVLLITDMDFLPIRKFSFSGQGQLFAIEILTDEEFEFLKPHAIEHDATLLSIRPLSRDVHNVSTDVHDVAQADVLQTLSLLTPFQVMGQRKIRVGRENDGGYIMLDDFRETKIAYSIGIGNDVSWDLDIAERGLSVFQYDHTIESLPATHPNFHYRKIGLAATNRSDTQFRDLESLIAENDHEDSGLILKMDIEDAEWDVLEHLPIQVLTQFKQIVIEFHGLRRLNQPSWLSKMRLVFAKLLLTHAPFHVHGNNYGDYSIVCGIPVPDVLEVSFANRQQYQFKENKDVYPTNLDAPCRADAPDFYLNRFQFLAS